ncbi:prostaglandin E2 receptor EP4 subtype-like [Pecten maximus]|uniref:prostaglandin E2 receptor EP4 subtype-like n=1 Tax=Pecten maximus TaxID=6579 RepID=UPI001458FE22|nr:prostaglandin E2 receptor EP4 subtype-like [Pecten maximus]XP_033737501.1 prostaglandin E2 receptor EP4 subtype-like [Pecten maximus]
MMADSLQNSTADLNAGESATPWPAIVMFTAGVTGNVLALIVLIKSPKEQRRSVFYRLVGVLALTDLLGICATSPVTFMVYANQIRLKEKPQICNYSSFMMIFFGFATVFVVAVMGVERYLALMHPFLYNEKVTTSKVTQTLIGFFVAALILGSLPLLGLGSNIVHYPDTWCFFNFNGDTIEDSIYAFLYSCVGILMILMLIFTNVIVTCLLIKMRRSSALPHYSSNTGPPEQELQMIVFLSGITFIFVACWSPLMVVVLLKQTKMTSFSLDIDLIVIRCAAFNQILDPWIYILLRRHLVFKIITGLRRSVCRCKNDQSTSDNSNDVVDRFDITSSSSQNVTGHTNGSYLDSTHSSSITLNGLNGTSVATISNGALVLSNGTCRGDQKVKENGSFTKLPNDNGQSNGGFSQSDTEETPTIVELSNGAIICSQL